MDTDTAGAVNDLGWYHTIDLPGSGPTPGLYDLRDLAKEVLPADLTGKRCLDACSSTGFWAFEMEKRGASEVIALDVASYADKDWRRPWLAPDAPELQGQTFQVAKQALGSAVERREQNVYDVTPGSLGSFDFIFIGSVLLHLRDPVRALRALHALTRDQLLSFEPVLMGASMLHRKTAWGRMVAGNDSRWWTPNAVAHREWLLAAGFTIQQVSRHRQPFGAMRPHFSLRPRDGYNPVAFAIERRRGVASQRLLVTRNATAT
jgi:tRNA (mo5U34)-methyltransferase